MLLILSLFVLGALWLARWFIRHDKGELEPRRALWGFVLYGCCGHDCGWHLRVNLYKHDITNPDLFFSTRTLFIDFMLVGIIEEAVKFLPLLVWLWRKPYFTERTDGVIYFALCGLGFGFAENILYTLADGAGTGIGRLIIVSFFHAALTGLRAILWPAPKPRDYQSGLRYCHWPWLWCCTACMILGCPAVHPCLSWARCP